jgi:hypothetical protein
VVYSSHPQSAKAKRDPILYTESSIPPMLMKMNEHNEYVREKPCYSNGLKNIQVSEQAVQSLDKSVCAQAIYHQNLATTAPRF